MAVMYIDNIPVPTEKQSPFVMVSRSGIPVSSYTEVQIRPDKDIQKVLNHFKLRAANLYLVASAVVANRVLKGTISKYGGDTNNTPITFQVSSANVAASQTGKLLLAQLGVITGASYSGPDVINVLEVNDFILYGRDVVSLSLSNSQAGDVFSVSFEFEYLNHRLGITER